MACSGCGDSILCMGFPATWLAWARAAPLKPSVLRLIVSMTILSHQREEVKRSHSTVTGGMILYWLLRSFTFVIISFGVWAHHMFAALLILLIMTSYVWIPFYAGEGYTPQFADRILGLIGDFLLLISIVIPHSWSARTSGLLDRIAIIVSAVLWILVVDVVAYKRGLTNMLLTSYSVLALFVSTALLATLAMQFKTRRRTSA